MSNSTKMKTNNSRELIRNNQRTVILWYNSALISLLLALTLDRSASAFSTVSTTSTRPKPHIPRHSQEGAVNKCYNGLISLWAQKSSFRSPKSSASGGGGGGPSTGRKKQTRQRNRSSGTNGPTAPNRKEASSSLESSSTSSSQQTSPSFKRKPKKVSSPPWQVLNPEQAKANIEKEKKRRELARQGFKNPVVEDGTAVVLSKQFLDTSDKQLFKWSPFNPDKTVCGMRFVGAYLGKQFPQRLGCPEVAFLGRSNVGKSSLLNKLSAARASSTISDQARVGKTPGATASVNLYSLIDKDERPILGLVDLPGYGFAKLSKDVKQSVQTAAEYYLNNRKDLSLGILLVDLRRTPGDNDRAVLAALYDIGVPIVVVATKADMVKDNERRERMIDIQIGLGLPEGQPLCVSSVTGEGCRMLWRIMLEACESHVLSRKQRYEAEQSEGSSEMEFDTFEDNDDLVYNQGYDWIQMEADTEIDHDDGTDALEVGSRTNDTGKEDDATAGESFKEMKKRVRDMTRRGDV